MARTAAKRNALTMFGPWDHPVDRLWYLSALQNTGFWIDLNIAWRSGEDLQDWRQQYFVRDQWLKETVEATLGFWSENPDSQEANLQGATWFVHRELEIPAFQTDFVPPPSIATDSACGFEVDEYLASNVDAFKTQHQAHAEKIRDVFRILTSHSLRNHCTWCAAYQSGASYRDLEDSFRNRMYSTRTIRMGIRRFAERIGITLRGNTEYAIPCVFPSDEFHARNIK